MFTETLKTLFKIWSCLIDAERVQSIFQGLPEPISTIRPIRTRLVLMNPFRVFQVMIQILKDMGVTEYEPRVINQMLEFTYSKSLKKKKVQIRWPLAGSDLWPLLSSGYVTTIIEDAKIYASHAKKSAVDADDIKLAIQCRMDQSFTSPPPRDVSPAKLWPRARFWFWFWCPWCALCPVPTGGGAAEEPDAAAAHQALHRPASAARPLLPHRSQLPPQVHPEEGLLLFLTPTPALMTSDLSPLFPCRCRHPPAGYRCPASASAPSPADPQRLHWVSPGEEPVEPVRSLTSDPSVWSSGTPSVQSVSSKVGTPVSLTGQRFTVQIPPPSQTATTKTSKTFSLPVGRAQSDQFRFQSRFCPRAVPQVPERF